MSYNRKTQAPCSATCCVPSDYNTSTVSWLQDITGTSYNIVATSGVFSNSLTVSADDMIWQMPTAVVKGSIVTCDSEDMSMSVSATASPSSDPSGNQTPTYAKTCAWTGSCTDPACSDYPSDWQCGDDESYYATKCISTSAFGHDACFPDDPLGYDDVAILTMGGDRSVCGGGGSVVDATWYATGLSIKGTPNTFVGYPSTLDACGSVRKGLRKIYAKSSGGGIQIKWLVAKEWNDGTANILYEDTLSSATNQLGEYCTGIQNNVDVGIQAVGSTSSTTLWRTIRLGDGTGDGSFGDGSGWYDITNTAVEFQYQKPNEYRWGCTIKIDYGGEHCNYCCDDSCTCPYTGWTWVSAYRQITTSGQVQDGSGNQIWDAGQGGANLDAFF